MPKVEITDEMVERACKSYKSNAYSALEGDMRAALDAALNPPPEIPVTEEMQNAGGDVLVTLKGSGMMMVSVAAECYRAMRKLEPPAFTYIRTGYIYDQDKGWMPFQHKDDPNMQQSAFSHRRIGEGDFLSRLTEHRRKDDPR